MRGVTHDVSIDRERGVVTKRFRSWARNEPAREWAALRLLAGSAAGLAPRPLTASLAAGPPVIRMSWLPGEPLGAGPVAPEQAQALAGSLDPLWRSVPAGRLAGLPARSPTRRPSPARCGRAWPRATTSAATRSCAALQFRRLAALFWLLLLRPGGRASRRNPPGTLRRQADRLLALLG